MTLYLSTKKSLREEQIRQITGIKYPAFALLLTRYRAAREGRLGRPPRHGAFVELVVALLVLRHDLTLRAVEALTGLDHVTISRIVGRVADALGHLRAPRADARYWVVDGTIMRASCRENKFYSGYRKKPAIKAQVVCDDTGQVVAADGGFPGSWHDKKIWNRLVGTLAPPVLVLADKGYVGGIGEGDFLIRPTKSKEHRAAQPHIENHARKRVVIEHVFARMKRFRCLRWWRRHDASHTKILRLIAEICNIENELRQAA